MSNQPNPPEYAIPADPTVLAKIVLNWYAPLELAALHDLICEHLSRLPREAFETH
jgi:hypothetical protein